jgi:hypothetical protein
VWGFIENVRNTIYMSNILCGFIDNEKYNMSNILCVVYWEREIQYMSNILCGVLLRTLEIQYMSNILRGVYWEREIQYTDE